MDKVSGQSGSAAHLFPPIEPFDQRMVDVGDGHVVYVEQCGNPSGRPVVVLHGGPGGGCSPSMRRYFDPAVYRVILFDQRGCGRSRPNAEVEANTTWHLIRDIEQIRTLLGIESWIVFGGSWGATLALLYTQAHAARVEALVLRGVFLMTQTELDWFYGGGVGRFWPELWDKFAGLLPEDERDDIIGAYHRRLFCGDRGIEGQFARAWVQWENALASVQSDGFGGEAPSDYARAFARLECHYFFNGGFLAENQAILRNMDKIAHIPGVIVQGRFDMICPPQAAHRLAKAWPKAQLHMVARSGHALSEPAITHMLLRTMRAISEH